MVSRIQQFLAAAVVALILIWAICSLSAARPALAWVGAAVILLGYGSFLALEFMLLYLVQRKEPEGGPRVVQMLKAWVGELLNSPVVFLWRQPFRWKVQGDHLPPDAVGRTGVVLVHGFLCNRGFWNPWMRTLRALDIPFIAINLEPAFGSIDHYPSLIEQAMKRIESVTSAPVVLVGHSMGGMAIRAWFAGTSVTKRVKRIITIGSPHHGTWLARYGRTTNGGQMRIGSDWLNQLGAIETALSPTRFTCFFGDCDNIVFPTRSATMDGAENLLIPATAHVHMAFHPTVIGEALRWLIPGDAIA